LQFGGAKPTKAPRGDGTGINVFLRLFSWEFRPCLLDAMGRCSNWN